MTQKLTKRFVKAIPWTLGDAAVSAVYGVVMIVLLGRFVSAKDVGIGSLAIAICQIVEALTSGGLQEAVIRAKSGDTNVTDTAYVLSVVSSIFGFLVCVAIAWPVGLAFQDNRIISLVSVFAVSLMVNALAIIPTAILARKMRASALTRRFIFGKISGIFVLLVTGSFGLGPWCLVVSGLAVSIGSLISVFVGSPRWPRLRYMKIHASELFKFGRLIAMDNFAWICMTRAFTVVFGFFHGVTELGYFQFAQRMVDEIAALLQTSFTRLGLSYFSGLDRERADMTSTFLFATRVMATGSVGIYIGVALVAPDLVPSLFGAAWRPMTPYIQLLAFGSALSFPFVLTPPLLKAKGRPDLLFQFGVCKGAVTLAACALTGGLPAIFGVACAALGGLIVIPWSLFQVRGQLGVPMIVQVQEMIPALLSAAVMLGAVEIVNRNTQSMGFSGRLVFASISGAIVYVVSIWALDPVLRKTVRTMALRIRRAGALPVS